MVTDKHDLGFAGKHSTVLVNVLAVTGKLVEATHFERAEKDTESGIQFQKINICEVPSREWTHQGVCPSPRWTRTDHVTATTRRSISRMTRHVTDGLTGRMSEPCDNDRVHKPMHQHRDE